ncbi:endonuclease/exonuclease/phosphatase family protein [Pseudaquabacterium terrae]|uniref:endonuclease/exonuclease/phosphatase family protein n=1 Tax=Pseudaquabacterium terrae TaxID=2732868 RepID=UPI0031B61972
MLTWNIQWGRGADGRVDLDRVVGEIECLGTPEIICLQEVADGFSATELAGCDGRDQFAALARRLPRHRAVAGVATDMAASARRRRRFGNMILTRLPIESVRRHLLPWPADPAVRSMQRMALEVIIDTAIGPLRVMTTHLEYYSARQRAAQVECLRALHADAADHARRARPRSGSGGPYDAAIGATAAILTGDFNCGPRSPERTRLVAPFDDATPSWRDAWEAACPAVEHPLTAGVHDRVQWNDQPQSFDTVFVTEDLAGRVRAVAVDAACIASDHQPLIVDLEMHA